MMFYGGILRAGHSLFFLHYQLLTLAFQQHVRAISNEDSDFYMTPVKMWEARDEGERRNRCSNMPEAYAFVQAAWLLSHIYGMR